MLFIVSTGRSGTKSLAQTLNKIHGIACVHEPHPLLAVEASEYRYGFISKEHIKNLLLETRKPIMGGIYCESNQALSLIIPILLETFPRARFIWLIRNGLDVVASAMQKQWYTGHSENYDRFEDSTPIQQIWINARLNGYKCGEMSQNIWIHLSRFEKCCWYWDYVNRIIESDLKKYNHTKYFILQLEKIRTQLPSLLTWIGASDISQPIISIANKAKRPPYHWSKWTHSEKLIFQMRCGSRMSNLYPEWIYSDGSWRGVPYQMEPSRKYTTYLLGWIKRWFRKFQKNI